MNIQTATMGDLAESFVDGPFGSNLRTTDYVENGVPVIRIQNVRPNKFNNSNLTYITEAKAKELSRHDYKAGDLLITKLGDPCGVACIVPSECNSGRIVADVTRFRGKCDRIDHKYLAYYLNSDAGQGEVQRRAKGTTRQRINLGSLSVRPERS